MQPTERFSAHVEDYTRYRPGYPPDCINFLQQTFSINKNKVIADIGSGTGILTKLLLQTGAKVIGVEPNDNMRSSAEEQLAGNKKFISIKGKGEDTNLQDHSVDIITVAQAFHWMDEKKTKKEFIRILKPKGFTAILWNIQTAVSPFGSGYEKLKEKYGKDYISIRKSHEPDLAAFFKPRKYHIVKFPHHLLLDEQGLHGLIHSSSFMPVPVSPHYQQMNEDVSNLFHKHQENGLVRMDYESVLHYGI